MSPVATLFFQWGRCYSGFVTPLYGALLKPCSSKRSSRSPRCPPLTVQTAIPRAYLSLRAARSVSCLAAANRKDDRALEPVLSGRSRYGAELAAMPAKIATGWTRPVERTVKDRLGCTISISLIRFSQVYTIWIKLALADRSTQERRQTGTSFLCNRPTGAQPSVTCDAVLLPLVVPLLTSSRFGCDSALHKL